MKNFLFYILHIFIFCFILSKKKKKYDLDEILNALNLDYFKPENKNTTNINTDTIQYGLTYDDTSVVKVFIKLVEKLKKNVKFVAFLKSQYKKKEYLLNCSNTSKDLIECYSEPNIQLDTEDRYYIYYNRSRNETILFDYLNVLEDDKRISLIFKPGLYVNQTVYKDNKKVMAIIDKKVVAEGYLYIVKKSKKLLNKPKDGFNKYIGLNNFVSRGGIVGYRPKDTLDGYKEAIRRGYHFLEAEVQFTKDKVPIIYNEKKDFSSKTFKSLEKKGDVLTLIDLLILCKENEVIIELSFSFLDFKDELSDISEYSKIIMNNVKKSDTLDSVVFNDNLNEKFILELKKLNDDITIAVSNINRKRDIDEKKDKYKGTKRIIYNINGISEGKNIDEETVMYGLSLGHKIKASIIEEKDLAEKIGSWGTNYITSDNIPPFMIQNQKELPMRVKCIPIFLDDLSECKMGDEIVLRDNEYYNIYYSNNIYNKSEDINETAIGEFRYEDTKINKNLYYIVKYINFKRGIIQLITSNKVRKGKSIKGVIGPDYDNVAKCYQYDFICEGNNHHSINCEIQKDPDKVEYNGKYVIYYLENYSMNEEEIEDYNLSKLRTKHIYTKRERILYTLVVIVVSMTFFTIFYYFQDKKTLYTFSERIDKNRKVQSIYKKLIVFEKNN